MVKVVADFEIENKESQEEKHYVYLFCSIDIVQSTYLKSINPRWAQLFNQFYDTSQKKLSEYELEFWKYVGDEVLFYKKLTSEDLNTFYSFPDKLFKSMHFIQKRLHEFFPETKMFLALKGTVWISKVLETNLNDLNNLETLNKNIRIKKSPKLTYSSYPQEFIDFLGPDIDLGFRISKKAIKNQLLVSAEFVEMQSITAQEPYNIPEAQAFLSHYRRIGNEQLKGIWHGRAYPIIMYRPDWKGDIFEYDEKNYKIQDLKDDVAPYLDRVFVSIGKKDEIGDYVSTIGETKRERTKVLKIESPVDVHLAAILFNDKGEVLLLKRGEKKSSPDKYDFGCTNLRNGQSIEDTLLEYYDFGDNCTLNLMKYEDTQKPIPIAVYEYEKTKGNIINGLLFTGKLTLDSSPSTFHEYENYQFFEQSKLQDINLFPDSIDNIKSAYKKIQI
ncbi:hypothetical protein ACVRZS_09340 [Streptococcus ferus]|uniref:Nudix hydrolase domain-containing protein n=1 Tax=Streptococcus ferus TaxID=1345 RepID=A0A2X3XU87_9STRE|nr:hypothetical protein [Streptococcus ferus]SQF38951.1 Uncharacterised protein [Streptococcus ferus]